MVLSVTGIPFTSRLWTCTTCLITPPVLDTSDLMPSRIGTLSIWTSEDQPLVLFSRFSCYVAVVESLNKLFYPC